MSGTTPSGAIETKVDTEGNATCGDNGRQRGEKGETKKVEQATGGSAPPLPSNILRVVFHDLECWNAKGNITPVPESGDYEAHGYLGGLDIHPPEEDEM